MTHTNESQLTVIRSMKALINGKIVKVEQLKGKSHKQHIEYRIITDSGDVVVDSNHFWSMNPEIFKFN